MSEIAYLVPGVGLDREELERREAIANDLVADNVTVLEVDSGPLSIENSVEEEWAAVGLLELTGEYGDAFDAFVIGCFGDPGLAGTRELTTVPVVGPAAASFHTATQLADQFSCLTILDSTVPMTHRLIEHYHLDHQLASVRVVEAPVLEIDHGSDDLVREMIETGRAAIEEDGAQALVPGCMSLAFMQVHDEIASALGVPFIDPVSITLETASVWARHGLTQSPLAYPAADRSKLGALLGEELVAADD